MDSTLSLLIILVLGLAAGIGLGWFLGSLALLAGGAVLVVSQFTLYADVSRGRRPGYSHAAPPAEAAPLCDAVVARLRAAGVTVATGVFGAEMRVSLVNDGPYTIVLDTDTQAYPAGIVPSP